MPELPEAETIARDLDRALAGARVAKAELVFKPSLEGPLPLSRLNGKAFRSAFRRGKHVAMSFEGDLTLVASLRMTGQFVFARAPGASPDRGWPKHARAAFRLDGFTGPEGEDALAFLDVRKFGRLRLLQATSPETLLPPSLNGPEITDLDGETLFKALAASKAPVKSVLMDQKVMAGLGNIYATEILFAARVSPFRPAASITRPESDIILEAAGTILAEAVSLRGSTVSNYRAPLGPGRYQERHLAYGKAGKPCPRCGMPLERAVTAGRATVYCPHCQK
ncbi:MAG: bifunctional DNA-formamidopyrimidine glycosylase/DNA-(apurinic or apyrimidinic site) lyase [Deltaproteobacteria bacterium]|jgi:formamidopyrimidine-DNA glycosylase|nr:bifunctional DNA-formamidopyrimidine glycosylase/DNA-(apurinic or apyrimidinic site) lyase [Deltaproteobacteria bacterium]